VLLKSPPLLLLLGVGCACVVPLLFCAPVFAQVQATIQAQTQAQSPLNSLDLRVARPAITLDMSQPLVAAGTNREAVAEAEETPGIYRAFLVWRQKYAHLAICNTYLCHGSCIEFGDGCLVSAQSPVLPILLEQVGASASKSSCGSDPVSARKNQSEELPSSCGGENTGASRCH